MLMCRRLFAAAHRPVRANRLRSVRTPSALCSQGVEVSGGSVSTVTGRNLDCDKPLHHGDRCQLPMRSPRCRPEVEILHRTVAPPTCHVPVTHGLGQDLGRHRGAVRSDEPQCMSTYNSPKMAWLTGAIAGPRPDPGSGPVLWWRPATDGEASTTGVSAPRSRTPRRRPGP
jgi:hypothetical protein